VPDLDHRHGGVETLTHWEVVVKIVLTNAQITLNDYKILKQSVQIPKYFVGGHLES
jgi:lysozyme family protein